MKMKCPYCDIVDGFGAIHRHILKEHLEMVVTEHDEATNKMHYTISCPFCEDEHLHQVKPRDNDFRFVDEFKLKIAMLAFDQMLCHILEKHPQDIGVDLDELEANHGVATPDFDDVVM